MNFSTIMSFGGEVSFLGLAIGASLLMPTGVNGLEFGVKVLAVSFIVGAPISAVGVKD